MKNIINFIKKHYDLILVILCILMLVIAKAEFFMIFTILNSFILLFILKEVKALSKK